MNPNLDLQDRIIRDRQHQLRAEAADWRLLNEEQTDSKESKPIYGPFLAQAGAILSEIGKQLQDRYGQAMDVSPLIEPPSGEVPC